MSKSCDSGKVFIYAKLVDGRERPQFDSVWVFSFPGQFLWSLLSFHRAPLRLWEEPSRSQQTRPAHNHIISISSTTWPTDDRDQGLALDENAFSALQINMLSERKLWFSSLILMLFVGLLAEGCCGCVKVTVTRRCGLLLFWKGLKQSILCYTNSFSNVK